MENSNATTRKRVKLYMLNEKKEWDDKGTGHVSAVTKDNNNLSLVVISENDGSYLLESKVLPDTPYHRQQHTLIVWSEGENVDLALSFQEKNGCNDIWEKICQVQGKDPSVDVTQEIVDESDDGEDSESYNQSSIQGGGYIELPSCELGRLDDICDLFNSISANQPKKERLIASLEHNNYLSKLVEVFHSAEDLDAEDSLHQLFEIMRHIIMLNKPSLYEILFSEPILMDVIGMLEYTPNGRQYHREFLRNQSRFKEVLKINNRDLVAKIHQTYRVQYIQECCLPPPCLFVDEHSLSALKSFIQINKAEIISAIQDNVEYLENLFSLLRDRSKTDDEKRDFALLAKEFCNISVQSEQKENSLSCMYQHGTLQAVEILLRSKDRDIRSAALDILNAFVDNQASIVREHIIKNCGHSADEDLLINIMIQEIIDDSDCEMGDASILSSMLRTLIDPDNMNSSSQVFTRGEKPEFLNFFYKHSMQYLTKPLFENTIKDYPIKDDYHTALVMHHIIDLLTFCFENHNFNIRTYCFNNELIKKVLVLLRSSHGFLVLNALRLLRKVIGLNDEIYFRYIIKNAFFKPVIDLFIKNGHRYNLIDSAVIELFQYIRSEQIITLITNIIETYYDNILSKIDYLPVFEEIKKIYENNRSFRINRNTSAQMNIMPLVGSSVGGVGNLGTGGRLSVIAAGGSLVNVSSNLRVGAVSNSSPGLLNSTTGPGLLTDSGKLGLLTGAASVGLRNSLDNTNQRNIQSSFLDEEEQWFNQSDDEDEDSETPSNISKQTGSNSWLDGNNCSSESQDTLSHINQPQVAIEMLSRYCSESNEEKRHLLNEQSLSEKDSTVRFRPRLMSKFSIENEDQESFDKSERWSKLKSLGTSEDSHTDSGPKIGPQSMRISFAPDLAQRIDPFSVLAIANEDEGKEPKFISAGSKRSIDKVDPETIKSKISNDVEDSNKIVQDSDYINEVVSPPCSLVDYSDEEDDTESSIQDKSDPKINETKFEHLKSRSKVSEQSEFTVHEHSISPNEAN